MIEVTLSDSFADAYADAASENRELIVRPGWHGLDRPLIGPPPPVLDFRGSGLRVVEDIPVAIEWENPDQLFEVRGTLKLDSNCKAQTGVRINGLRQKVNLCINQRSALQDGIELLGNRNHGIYDNRMSLFSAYNGRHGINAHNDETNPANRTNANWIHAHVIANRGAGVYMRNSQCAWYVHASRNQGPGVDVDNVYRVTDFIGGYFEDNARFEYALPCGEDVSLNPVDNGKQNTIGIQVGARAYNVTKVGGGHFDSIGGTPYNDPNWPDWHFKDLRNNG